MTGSYGVLLCSYFLSHIQVFSCEMLRNSGLKCPQSCFPSHFCFLVIVILLVFVWSILFLVACNQYPALFYVVFESLYRCINAVFNTGKSSSSFFSFTYSLSISSLGCSALCMVIIFLVLWSICFISSLVHFQNGPEYLTRGYNPGIYFFDKVSAIKFCLE